MTISPSPVTGCDLPQDNAQRGIIMTEQGECVCGWHRQMPDYHAREWGRPVTEDRLIFEKVCLESFQSGLSWQTVLRKRDAFRQAFSGFDFYRVAEFTDEDIQRLLNNREIIRNRRKIISAIHNARRAIEMVSEVGSLAAWFWQFEPLPTDRPLQVDSVYLLNNPFSPASMAMARGLKKRGWTWVGPVTCYSLMQALGIVNDHLEGCRYRAPCEAERKRVVRPCLPVK